MTDDFPAPSTVRLRLADAGALTETYRTYQARLVRYACGFTGDAATAHDVVQDVFVTLWEQREALVVERSLQALLYTMTRNRALNLKHRAARLDRSTPAEDLVFDRALGADAAPAPDALLHVADLQRHLQRWIDALPPRRGEAFQLSRFHALSHAEIAAVMGLSIRTVDTHIVHALRDLRLRLDALHQLPSDL